MNAPNPVDRPLPPKAEDYRPAPIEQQIDALRRAKQRQDNYHAKCLSGENPRIDGRFVRLESFRLESAIRTLEQVMLRGIAP